MPLFDLECGNHPPSVQTTSSSCAHSDYSPSGTQPHSIHFYIIQRPTKGVRKKQRLIHLDARFVLDGGGGGGSCHGGGAGEGVGEDAAAGCAKGVMRISVNARVIQCGRTTSLSLDWMMERNPEDLKIGGDELN
ncbi:hypothetical protein M422DRAFT_257687 [Sphaerobolus stellatus SS14]|uniref:Uncharacterized protein n=1 Tax=Sphaerobolus stellatus (strain SS14) TaxID=990650 RepID=A0A0C9VNI1_SPHS4|nr:hypothetical protein M422DRAFT_257687 [Sphaerobolus stellatus SS14]